MSHTPLTRRDAVKLISASALAAPAILGAGRKSGLQAIVIGTGAHQYEVQHDFGVLPAGHAWGNTHGVCEDKAGHIYIKHTVHASASNADAIVVLDASGKFVRSFGAEYRGGAHGLHLSRETDGEFLYLCDPNRGLVEKTTLAGERIWRKECPLESGVYNNANEYHPTNVAVVPHDINSSAAGSFFIADGYGKSWIHRYNAKGEYLGTFGGPGRERGQLSCPHGLMIDARDAKTPKLVVADRSNRRLQYFTLEGRHLGFVTDELKSPCHFDIRGDLLLVPDLDARVTLLDRDNKLVCHLGDAENYALRDKPRDQFVPGKFIAPHSAIFDHDGNIFVVEWVEVGRVTKLKKL
jgi:hypothetical protein